jgi:ferredoxin
MQVVIESPLFKGELKWFGLCKGEFWCHTCRVDIITGYDRLPAPLAKEEDAFDILGSLYLKSYRKGSTRMACQIKVTKELEGALIEIPERRAWGDI